MVAEAVRQVTYIQAINEAIRQEMERDENVIVMGEDIAGGGDREDKQDAWGGPMRLTKGTGRPVRPRQGARYTHLGGRIRRRGSGRCGLGAAARRRSDVRRILRRMR